MRASTGARPGGMIVVGSGSMVAGLTSGELFGKDS